MNVGQGGFSSEEALLWDEFHQSFEEHRLVEDFLALCLVIIDVDDDLLRFDLEGQDPAAYIPYRIDNECVLELVLGVFLG